MANSKTRLVVRKRTQDAGMLPDFRMRGLAYIKRLEEYFNPSEISSLEESIFKLENSETGYVSLLMRVVKNLDPTCSVSNKYLLPRVQAGEIPLLKVPTMSPAEMFPERWKEHIKKSAAEARQAAAGELVATTNVIKCRCGSAVSYKEMQMRSADEAMTLIVKCPACGKKFNI
jgi:DNA-directed RNA polymerase subunit M/transcription elongation factor TFIIS